MRNVQVNIQAFSFNLLILFTWLELLRNISPLSWNQQPYSNFYAHVDVFLVWVHGGKLDHTA